MTDTILIYDIQQNKTYMMHKARANHLCQSYPNRFKYANTPKEKEENKMPALPELLEALPNGSHHVKVIECRTVKSNLYDIQQEEITIITDGTGKKSKMWLSWNSRKKINEAAKAGFVEIDEASQEWHVIIGATFTLVIANNKAVAWVSDKPEG